MKKILLLTAALVTVAASARASDQWPTPEEYAAMEKAGEEQQRKLCDVKGPSYFFDSKTFACLKHCDAECVQRDKARTAGYARCMGDFLTPNQQLGVNFLVYADRVCSVYK
jgi:hypothetical protein